MDGSRLWVWRVRKCLVVVAVLAFSRGNENTVATGDTKAKPASIPANKKAVVVQRL
jgi:hypothetical protein